MHSRDFQADLIPYAPVLYPNAKEFSDFNGYIEQVEKEYSELYGMVKIVPPKSWKAREADYEGTLDERMITGPIEQNPYGKGGVYECVHIMKKSIPFKEYRKKAKVFDKVTEGLSNEKVEELFWKNISFSPPLYGSDMQMSLFDDNVNWSLNDLQSILSDGLTSKISGVNTPYLYIGSWKTLFAWHKEDLDLGAINYVHYGKPKFWYCISRSDSHKLEATARSNFIENFAKCPEFLRHKTTVINPYNITKKLKGDIKISKMAQNPGEFIVVFSGAYHHGFNWGYNIAEAVNYATLSWLNFFPYSKSCRCSSDTVSIDHNDFLKNLLKNRPDVKEREEIKNFQVWQRERNKQEGRRQRGRPRLADIEAEKQSQCKTNEGHHSIDVEQQGETEILDTDKMLCVEDEYIVSSEMESTSVPQQQVLINLPKKRGRKPKNISGNILIKKITKVKPKNIQTSPSLTKKTSHHSKKVEEL